VSKKRKPRKRVNRKSSPFSRPPTPAESMEIAMEIFGFAELVANRQPREAVDAIRDWLGPDSPVAVLRCWYLATTAPLLGMALVRKHFPVDMEPDGIWTLGTAPGVTLGDRDDDRAAEVMAQVLVRYLNDDTETAYDLITAHCNTYGPEGLFWVGCEAIKFMAGVLIYAKKQRDGGA
jgi:hypothetical protein